MGDSLKNGVTQSCSNCACEEVCSIKFSFEERASDAIELLADNAEERMTRVLIVGGIKRSLGVTLAEFCKYYHKGDAYC